MTVVGLLAYVMLGCQSARLGQPVARELAGSDPDAQIEFWHSLNDAPVCSNDQAMHGLLLYFDNKDDTKSYDERVALLKSRKMLPGNFNEPADAALQRGTLAIALVRALHIRGGLMMSVFDPFIGPTPRYALRELEFVGLYPPGSPRQTFSGSEFVGIIGRVEDYQRGDPTNSPATVMPAQAAAATSP